MRSLSSTLEKAQKAAFVEPLIKIVLTHGEDTQTFTKTRILDLTYKENGSLQSCEITLDDNDSSLTELDLRGYKGVLSAGVMTSAGEEYSPHAPMWVVAQTFGSTADKLTCILSLKGICNLMMEDKANQTYQPDDEDTKTVKQLIREIAGDSGVTMLACFNHCSKYDVVFDSEDDLIGTYTPRDAFRIYIGNNRLSAINRLLDYTKCVLRVENDGKLHCFQPTTSGTTYHAEYSL